MTRKQEIKILAVHQIKVIELTLEELKRSIFGTTKFQAATDKILEHTTTLRTLITEKQNL